MNHAEVRQMLREFYDNVGWRRDASTHYYRGKILHEDLDRTSQAYGRESEMRFRSWLSAGGRYFLDAGSGAQPRPDLAANFCRHVCADLSLVGLQEARGQLRSAGLYVVCDLAALPFRDGLFEGVLASHCLYHIERNTQPVVVRELHRVTAGGRNILIFYRAPRSLVRLLKDLLKAAGLGAGDPSIYSYLHDPAGLLRPYPGAEVHCLRTLGKQETEWLARWGLAGLVVRLLALVERAFPRWMRHIGEYVALRIPKRGEPSCGSAT